MLLEQYDFLIAMNWIGSKFTPNKSASNSEVEKPDFFAAGKVLLSAPCESAEQPDIKPIYIHMYAASENALDRASSEIEKLFRDLHHSEEILNIETDLLRHDFVRIFLCSAKFYVEYLIESALDYTEY